MRAEIRKRLGTVGLKFLVIAASTLIGLLIAEALVRIIAPQGVVFPWQDGVNGITAPRPGARGRHAIPNTFDVTVSFNSQRFRGQRDFRTDPQKKSHRLAILGDSFTFGFGANDDDTFPAQLEHILRGKLSEDSGAQAKAVEVINAGNGGTGTGEQALWYEIWVKNYRPQVVVLTVVPNDVDDDLNRKLFFLDESGKASPHPLQEINNADESLRSTRRFVNSVPGYGYIAQHSQLLALLRNTWSALLLSKRKGAFANSDKISVDADDKHKFIKEGIPLMSAEIEWLNARVKGEGAHLVVVLVPGRESVYESKDPREDLARWKSDTMANALNEVCSKNVIPFSNLTPVIREQAKQINRQLYYEGLDDHPNPRGYRIIAEAVADRLFQSGVLSANSR